MIRNHVRQHSRSDRLARAIALPLLVLGLLVTAGCGVVAQAKSEGQKANDLIWQGMKAQEAGRTSEAADDYRKALALDPRNKFAYFDLGVIDQGAGRNSSAELEYRTALQFDANFAEALYNLAVLRAQAAPAEAADLYRRVTAVKPGFADAHLNLGFLLISMGQKTEGKAELDRAVAIRPSLASRVPANIAATPSPTPTPKH
jgi:tetratricopeptide (TPR) repeat protein